MENKPFRLGITVGRFQTFHKGHQYMIDKAVALCESVGVFIGSSQESGTAKNPFSYETRERLLKKIYYSYKTAAPNGKPLALSASVACFVPKPHTPFEFFPQDSAEEFKRKIRLLLDSVPKKIKLSYHEPDLSIIEGAFARGDERLNDVIVSAYNKGCIFDSWTDHFDAGKWGEAFADCGLSVSEFAERRFGYDERLPWDIIDIGVSKAFLVKEAEKAGKAETTPNCFEKCSACGISEKDGKCRFEIQD